MQPGDILYDVFAGVGPFAVPAAKKKCVVLANDLNPESFKWLNHNLQLNKVKTEYSTHNLDGRDFIQTTIREDLLQRWQKTARSETAAHPNYHIVMNLPALALEFLSAFSGMLKSHNGRLDGSMVPSLPRVHCHCFSKAENPEQDVQEQAALQLGHDLQNSSVRHVRNVAPNKEMMCVSFDLTWNVLQSGEQDNGSGVSTLLLLPTIAGLGMLELYMTQIERIMYACLNTWQIYLKYSLYFPFHATHTPG